MSAPVVVVVDDSLTVRMDLADAFEAAGFAPVPCASIAEARAALQRARPDLIVLDVVLPDGDGVELLAEIRGSHAASVPVMMLSSEVELHDRLHGLRTGADEYVGKPYDVAYVIARARELVRAGEHGAGTGGDMSAAPALVLVIDDSATFREALREVLEAEGFAVALAESGEEGLRMTADLRPVALVVDGVLPGIDGATVIRRIRLDAALRSTPCLLLTASDSEDAELRALDAGADAFVRKSAELAVVVARLTAALRSAGRAIATAASSLSGPKRVLFIADGDDERESASAALRGEVYDIARVRSVGEATLLLAAQPVDCIVLVARADAESICREIKGAPVLREIPIVALTATDDALSTLALLAAGADDQMPTSTDPEVMRARLHAQIRRRQVEDEHRRHREHVLRMEREVAAAAAARQLAETRAALVEELERSNRELEAFSYSVSHDLRAPLRAIEGFSRALADELGESIGPTAKGYLARVRAGATRMDELIDDLLGLSRIGRVPLQRSQTDLSSLAEQVCVELVRSAPERTVQWSVAPGVAAFVDGRLVRIIFENLLGNAWKFTAKRAAARVEFGVTHEGSRTVYFVRDDGAGFDMHYARNLFVPFGRLHSEADFPGTGIGLATVQRVVERHGGRIWAEGVVDGGATISWTLPAGERVAGGTSLSDQEPLSDQKLEWEQNIPDPVPASSAHEPTRESPASSTETMKPPS